MVYWIIGICLALAAIAYLALRQDLHVVRYTLESDRLPPEARVRLVVVSDLHNTIYPGNQQALADVILGEKPDAVLITGDFFDEQGDAQGAKLLAAPFRGALPVTMLPEITNIGPLNRRQFSGSWAIWAALCCATARTGAVGPCQCSAGRLGRPGKNGD